MQLGPGFDPELFKNNDLLSFTDFELICNDAQ